MRAHLSYKCNHKITVQKWPFHCLNGTKSDFHLLCILSFSLVDNKWIESSLWKALNLS